MGRRMKGVRKALRRCGRRTKRRWKSERPRGYDPTSGKLKAPAIHSLSEGSSVAMPRWMTCHVMCCVVCRMLKARRALDSDEDWREMATLQELMNA